MVSGSILHLLTYSRSSLLHIGKLWNQWDMNHFAEVERCQWWVLSRAGRSKFVKDERPTNPRIYSIDRGIPLDAQETCRELVPLVYSHAVFSLCHFPTLLGSFEFVQGGPPTVCGPVGSGPRQQLRRSWRICALNKNRIHPIHYERFWKATD